MANKDTGRTQQSTDLNQDRKSPGMNQASQSQDRQQGQNRQQGQQSQVRSDDSVQADKSSSRIDQTDRKDL